MGADVPGHGHGTTKTWTTRRGRPEYRALTPQVPEAFERVVHTLLAKQPQDRYASATALRTALRELWPLVLPGMARVRPSLKGGPRLEVV